VFHTLDADDEAAWIGLSAFDPRAVASEAAIIRGAVETFFGAREAAPMPLLIMGHVRPLRLFSMSRRSNSMLLNVGMQEPWGPGGRIAVAHQVTQKWIGGAVWVGPGDPVHEAESYWFSEGVARFFARDILFRVGLLEPDELRDSVATDLAAWYTSPRQSEPNEALSAHVAKNGAMALLVARGALYAVGLNARLRAKSNGQRSLDMVMLALLREARESHRRVLPIASWLALLERELGDEEKSVFEQAIGKGQRLALPADALGPCFRRAEGKYARFDLGFDEAATRASPRHIVAGLAHGGPAERGGLRPTDVLVRASYDPGSPQTPAQLELERDGKPLKITYTPAGEARPGHVWLRRREIPNERCRP
jgi:predicted metalloprotease with PDZ domain